MRAAMLLCAGFGTRLRPLTDELPKPLVPLGDQPLLVHIARRLRAAGFDRLVVNTHHLHAAFFGISRDLGAELHVVHEPEIRGTAGGVAGARRLLGAGPIVVWNGDIVCDPALDELLLRVEPAGACLAVARAPAGEGTVGIGPDGEVVRLRGESFGREVAAGDFVGVSALGGELLAALPATGCLVGDVWLPALRRGVRLWTAPASGIWWDIGDLESYLAAQHAWLAEQATGAGGSWVASDAVVEAGVELKQSVVGAGARLLGHGLVERSVIWPGVTAQAPLSNAVVTARGSVTLTA